MSISSIDLAVSENAAGGNFLFSIRKHSKLIYALVLVFLVSLFMLSYRRSFIFPQQGWWQYYAWRMTEGDVLYKDLYLFIPPYYAMMTALLYRLFDTSFIYYSVFVGFPFRMIALLLIYSVLCRKTKPVYACAAVFFGECFNESFLMYAIYDYNPIGTTISLILAFVMLQFYEAEGKRAERKAFFAGLLCGILLMFKQTLGLGLSAVVVIMLFVLVIRQKRKNWLKIMLFYLFGCFDGLLPAIFYFMKYDCFRDFLHCIFQAGGAKGGSQGLLTHFVDILSQWQYWLVAVLLFILGIACKQKWDDQPDSDLSCSNPGNQRNLNKGLLSVTVIPFLAFLCALIFSRNLTTYHKLMLAVFFVSADLFLLSFLTFEDKKYWLHFSVILITAAAILVWNILPEEVVRNLYEKSAYWSVHSYMMNVLAYLTIVIWITELVKYFTSSGEGYSCLMFQTVTGCFFLISLISTSVMEATLIVLVIPWAIVFLLEISCPRKIVKDMALTAGMLIFVLLILSEKMIIPYDWQGWRLLPVQNNVPIEIAGLEGYRTDPETAAVYEEIVGMIEDNTSPEDTVYSFANIPLFNVLTHRKMPTYMPIHWFDVCPDEIAEEDCSRLLQNPPKIVIWHNTGDDHWDFLESVFRNGKRSGQRRIKTEFYNDFVLRQYTLLGEYDNHRDGTIQVWVKRI